MGTEYVFEDALTGATVSCGYPYLQSHFVKKSAGALACKSVFFPGCSFINYGLPLAQAVYDTLLQEGSVQGISLLCCGKILSYEPGGDALRVYFEEQFRCALSKAGVRRVVAACPNCVTALRNLCVVSDVTKDIEVVALPQELARLGYRIDPTAANGIAVPEALGKHAASGKALGKCAADVRAMGQAVCEQNLEQTSEQTAEQVAGKVAAQAATGESNQLTEQTVEQVVFCPHDSCPDRATGEFAQGMRTLAEKLAVVESAYNRSKSVCCGSLPRAAGNIKAADKCAQLCGTESASAGAHAILTPCVSCSFQLTMAQRKLPVFHYLELLYQWRIDWAHADQYMKLRFLFDDIPTEESAHSKRAFVSLAGERAECSQNKGNVSPDRAGEMAGEHKNKEEDVR